MSVLSSSKPHCLAVCVHAPAGHPSLLSAVPFAWQILPSCGASNLRNRSLRQVRLWGLLPQTSPNQLWRLRCGLLPRYFPL